MGTNMSHPEWLAQYGPQVMANPVGLSAALLSDDHWLMMGRRNARVAYHPNRIHPFAGSMDFHDAVDLFAEVRRELHEELALDAQHLGELTCVGMVRDPQLRQPEFVVRVRCRLSREQIERRLDTAEHRGIVAVRADQKGLTEALAQELLTPVAVGVLQRLIELAAEAR